MNNKDMKKLKQTKDLAILGASGHIGKNLVYYFSELLNFKLHLFARSITKMDGEIYKNPNITLCNYTEFNEGHYDVVINCIGFGNPKKVKESGFEIFEVTEQFDNLILDYLQSKPDSIYINLSSGAVFGNSFDLPVNLESNAIYGINNVSANDFYGMAKLYSEFKHRARPHNNIIDLRVYSFFSRFIDLNHRFLITEAIACIKERKILITSKDEIYRDYIHPLDLMNLIILCINNPSNIAIDVYSSSPISKFQLLQYFEYNHGLKWQISNFNNIDTSATGVKPNYYSNNRIANLLGYLPKFSSLDAIKTEVPYLLL